MILKMAIIDVFNGVQVSLLAMTFNRCAAGGEH